MHVTERTKQYTRMKSIVNLSDDVSAVVIPQTIHAGPSTSLTFIIA